MPKLESFFGSPLPERTAKTLTEFSSRMFKPGYLAMADMPLVMSPSIFVFILGMIVFSVILIYLSNRQDKLKISLSLGVLLAGALTNIGILLFSFLVLFTEYEGLRLASFERYLSTYTFAWFLIAFAMLSGTLAKIKIKFAMALYLVCFVENQRFEKRLP